MCNGKVMNRTYFDLNKLEKYLTRFISIKRPSFYSPWTKFYSPWSCILAHTPATHNSPHRTRQIEFGELVACPYKCHVSRSTGSGYLGQMVDWFTAFDFPRKNNGPRRWSKWCLYFVIQKYDLCSASNMSPLYAMWRHNRPHHNEMGLYL